MGARDDGKLQVALYNGNAITIEDLAALIFRAAGGGDPLLEAKGDLIVALAPALARGLEVGVDGTTLIADSAELLGIKWTVPLVGGGDVIGPVSAVDAHIVLFNGTTGKVLKTSAKSIADIFADHVALPDPHSQYVLTSVLSGYQLIDALLTSLSTLSFAGNGLKVLRVNAGATDFELITLTGGGDLLAANNLSDLLSPSSARSNLVLGNVDNVADANKPVSTAQQTEIDTKQDLDALLTSLSALSFATNTLKVLRVNAGETDFELVTIAAGGDMLAANNLSDVLSPSSARGNLGLGAIALLALIAEADLSLTDIATNNSSITKHGFLKKLSNIAANYMDGEGNWTTPPDTIVNQSITLSGDATGSGTTAITVVIGANKILTVMILDANVTLAKLADIGTKTYLGRTIGGTGVPAAIPVATLKSDLVLVKADVGLSNVDNVSDVNKPVSTAQQTALDGKVDDAEISNMDNTSDANKPVSSLQQTEIDTKQDLDTQLTDLAALVYTANALKVVRVNAGATGFELATAGGGSGDVVGPASAVDERIAVFDTTTGKLLKDGGVLIAGLQPIDALLTSLSLLAFASNTLKVLRVNAGETAFELVTLAGGGDLLAANNLSDLLSATTARLNLVLDQIDNTSDANKPVSTATNTQLGLKLVKLSNLSDLDNVVTARSNLGLAALALLAAVTEAEITLADNTTNDASITKHGFLPKLSNVATQYMNGIGAFSTPPDTVVNETITLTGDVTGTGTGSFAATIGANKVLTSHLLDANVTFAKLADIATKTYMGRTAGGTGVPSAIPVATLKTDLALVKADVGLANVDNVADASKSVLNATEWDGAVKTASTSAPSGGADGDIHFQYPA